MPGGSKGGGGILLRVTLEEPIDGVRLVWENAPGRVYGIWWAEEDAESYAGVLWFSGEEEEVVADFDVPSSDILLHFSEPGTWRLAEIIPRRWRLAQ